MSRLPPFVRKNARAGAATAIPATPATVGRECSNNSNCSSSIPPNETALTPPAVATIATVAVANDQPQFNPVSRWEIENPLPARSFAEGCAHCLKPVALESAVPVLAGREAGGHAWVHRACWRPMRESRRAEAKEALEIWRRWG
jgi:hypothetical protein